VNLLADLDNAQWNAILAECHEIYRDIYFTPQYHNLHEVNGDGKAFCMAIREGREILIVPGIQTPIRIPECDQCLWDIQTCNGYGGPVGSIPVNGYFLDCAWEMFREECQRRGIIAAFFRLHGLVRNRQFLPHDATVLVDRQTVYINLSQGLEAIWKKAKSQYRNMINKGRREGVQVTWNEPAAWDQLGDFYGLAMERLNAPASLRFSGAYFDALRALPGAELASIWNKNELVAISVFLFGPKWGHYHLSARNPDSGNHLHSVILQSAIERAAERGLSGLHLGGGRTTAEDDSLLRFKSSTGGETMFFNISLVITDRNKYNSLCEEWRRKQGRSPEWLLGYRQPAGTYLKK